MGLMELASRKKHVALNTLEHRASVFRDMNQDEAAMQLMKDEMIAAQLLNISSLARP